MNKCDDARHPDSGFTVLETIMAFVLISIVLFAATQSITASISLLRASEQTRKAGAIAEAVFAEALARKGPLGAPLSGFSENGLAWTLTGKPIAENKYGKAFTIFRLELSVSDRKTGKPVKVYSTYQAALVR